MKRLCWPVVVVALGACGAAETTDPENPLRVELEQAIAQQDVQQPLNLRFNPAACACPPVEVLLSGHWLRAEVNGPPELDAWLTRVAKTAPESLPVPLQVVGKLERDVLRTPQGSYAARVEVTQLVQQLPAKPR
jgi:hypothetical protein